MGRMDGEQPVPGFNGGRSTAPQGAAEGGTQAHHQAVLQATLFYFFHNINIPFPYISIYSDFPFYSRSLSSKMVKGPSLSSSTFISAPKIPCSTTGT